MIPQYYEFQNPTKIISGKNAIENIAFELQNLMAVRPMILTNGRGLEVILQHSFEGTGITAGNITKNIPPDSSVELINNIAKTYKDNTCDSVIAIGGGSVIDTAKGLIMLLTQDCDDLISLMGSEIIKKKSKIPFIAVPTTAGSGSEVTAAAVIKDLENDLKLEFLSYNLPADVAVLDVRATITMPAKLTASTGMDALTHAIEAYTGIQKNPLSDAYSFCAIELIRDNLITAVTNPLDEDARLAMANAALIAGASFSNSMVGLVHAIGHACGAVSGAAHGDAMAILLPYCMQYNLDVCESLYSRLLLPLCGVDIYAGTPQRKRAVRAITEVQALTQNLNKRSGMPLKLSACGVTVEKLPEIAKAALNDGAILMNPKDAGEDDISEILIKAF